MHSLDPIRHPLWTPRLYQWPVVFLFGLNTSIALSQESPKVETPKLQYRSVFAQYKAFNEQEVAPWRQTNDAVEKAGGWRVYAKEARQPDVAEKAKPESVSDKPKSHDEHGKKP